MSKVLETNKIAVWYIDPMVIDEIILNVKYSLWKDMGSYYSEIALGAEPLEKYIAWYEKRFNVIEENSPKKAFIEFFTNDEYSKWSLSELEEDRLDHEIWDLNSASVLNIVDDKWRGYKVLNEIIDDNDIDRLFNFRLIYLHNPHSEAHQKLYDFIEENY